MRNGWGFDNCPTVSYKWIEALKTTSGKGGDGDKQDQKPKAGRDGRKGKKHYHLVCNALGEDRGQGVEWGNTQKRKATPVKGVKASGWGVEMLKPQKNPVRKSPKIRLPSGKKQGSGWTSKYNSLNFL